MPQIHYDSNYAVLMNNRYGHKFLANHEQRLLHSAKDILKSSSPHKSIRVLEIGSNTGNFLDGLKSAYPFVERIGIDINESGLRVAVKKSHCVANGDAQALPLPDGIIDVVFSSHTFEHVPNLVLVFHELARVLKPAGKAFIIVPPNFGGLETIRMAYDNLPPIGRSWRKAHQLAKQLHCSPLGGIFGGARRHAQEIIRQNGIGLSIQGGRQLGLWLSSLLILKKAG